MMRSELVVANYKDLQNSDCDEHDNIGKIPLPLKEEIDNRGNVVFSEYEDNTFIESKVEIKENILEATTVLVKSALSEIEETANQKVSERQNNRENVLIRESFESQDLISSNLETNHDEGTLQPTVEIIVNEKSNEDGIADKICINTLTITERNAEKIKQNYFDISLNKDSERNISNSSSSKLNNDNIDVNDNVSRNRKRKFHAKDKAKQSNRQDRYESNVKVVELDGGVQSLPVRYNIEKEFVLSALVEKNAICEERIYEMMLDTKEKLFIFLRREDLYKLQEEHNQDHSETEEQGKVKWHRWTSNQAKRFWCRFCPFTADDKCTLMIHIVKNHKHLAPKKKFAPPECMTPGKDPSIIWYKCLECAYVTKELHSYFSHSFRHKPDELETLRCAHCSYETKWKYDLTKHFDVHKETYHKCTQCDFQTKRQKYMDTHVRMIHNSNAVELLKCKKCSFQTKYKSSLKGHMLTHNEVRKMYKCALCPFETPYPRILHKSHSNKHKSDEETRIYKCESCPYKAKMKCDLKKHMQCHKGIDEVKMYKCGICPYQTRHKCYINEHRMTHQALDEDNMHPCDLCPYQGKTKKLLIVHKRNHRTPDECKMYKCEKCPYMSRNSNNLKRHSMQHKSIDELTLFHCDKCTYRGSSKDRLRNHYNNVHKHPEDIEWRKCNVCDFKTKQGGNLRRHMLSHMDPKKANKFKCGNCSFRAKTKQEIKAHMVKHSNVYLKCDQCDYQSKFRSTLLRHRKQKHP